MSSEREILARGNTSFLILVDVGYVDGSRFAAAVARVVLTAGIYYFLKSTRIDHRADRKGAAAAVARRRIH